MANQNFMLVDPTTAGGGDVDVVTVYVGGDGILKKSTDGGQNWTNLLTTITDPPNAASDSPAPVDTDLTYTTGTFNQITGDIVIQAEWDNGTNWRAWLLNWDGATWTWTALSGTGGTDPETYSGTWLVNINPDDETYNDLDSVTSLVNSGSGNNASGGTSPEFHTNEQNGKSLVYFDESNFEYLSFGTSLGRPADWTIIMAVEWEAGFAALGNNTAPFGNAPDSSNPKTGWIVRNDITTDARRLGYHYGDDTNQSQGYTSANQVGDDEFMVLTYRYNGDPSGDTVVNIFKNGVGALATTTVTTAATDATGTTYESVLGKAGAWNSYYFLGYIGRMYVADAELSDADVAAYSQYLMEYYGLTAGSGNIRPLNIEADSAAGTNVYSAEWNGTSLQVTRRNTSLVIQNSITLNTVSVSEAALDARTYYVQVLPLAPPAGTASICYAYGRWDDGAVKHLVKTTDGFATVGASIGGSWGADWVSTLFALNENTLFAFVAGVSPTLYRTDDGGTNWTSLGALPFDVNSVSLSASGIMAICSDETGSQQVAMSESPFSTWTDANTGLDTLTSKKGIRWV